MSVNGYTATTMLCRKLLMNTAVSQGAPTNSRFIQYVNYLRDEHLIPPLATAWVDHIRDKGNAANHEIEQISQQDAEDIVIFTGMLLKLVYEFPNKLTTSASDQDGAAADGQ